MMYVSNSSVGLKTIFGKPVCYYLVPLKASFIQVKFAEQGSKQFRSVLSRVVFLQVFQELVRTNWCKRSFCYMEILMDF